MPMLTKAASCRRYGARATLAVFAFASVAGAAGSASAQTGTALPAIDARTWQPPADPDASMVLEPTLTPGNLQWNVAAWALYALEPVIAHDGAPSLHPVEHQVGADLVANVGLGRRFALGVDVPFFLWQTGDAIGVPTAGIGDVSLLGKATLVSNDKQSLRAGLGLAALVDVTLPTAPRSSFMGDGAVTASLRWLAEYSLGIGALRGSLGFLLRPNWRTGALSASDDLGTVGDALPWSLGIVLRPKALLPTIDSGDRQEWEIAAHGALPAGPIAPFGWGSGPGAAALSPALLSADDRIALGRHHDAYVLAGAEVGLDDALGVPAFRVVVSVGWAPRVHDRDGDGVPDDVDQCPDLPEDKDGIQDQDGCPEDDADGDGIPDDQDACPLVAGPASTDPKRNGCPSAGPR
jgi:hypothetical protein